MLEVVDMNPHDEPTDAVTDALAEMGRPQAIGDRDHEIAASVLGTFRAAQRRRARWRIGAGVGLAAAAAVVLSWAVIPQLADRSLQVSQGEFLVQQERVADGSKVAVGEWVEATETPACLQVGRRSVCGEKGSRLRVVDDDTVELARGRLKVDAGLVVLTPIGEVRSTGDGIELVLDAAGETIVLGDTPAVLVQDGDEVALAPGATANASGLVASPTMPDTADVEPPIVIADDDDDREPAIVRSKPSKPAAPTTEPAGAMLSAARELAGRGKLAQAATAYQRLIDAHPGSSEARAALVSLGRVQADRGKHGAALAAFSRYIAGGPGPLGEEAHFGKVGALHALGRAADRDRAVEAMAAAHPRSVYLAKARALAGR